MYFAAAVSVTLLLTLAIYGADYYMLPVGERPFSPKYALLRPAGRIGVNLGILGTVLFLIIFLYAVRKRVKWLARRGQAKHWMDFHIVAGVSAPFVIAFHASFKFRGVAGMAFWIMVAVALSGVVGRYLYAQIPHSLSAAELSLKELQESEALLSSQLAGQTFISASDLERVLRMPSPAQVRDMALFLAIFRMIVIDISRPWHFAALRLRASGWRGKFISIGGLRSTGNPQIEIIVQAARLKSSLSKKIVFLGRSQRVFHLWHVIHRPFSYAFAVLALLHIFIVIGLGFK